MSFPVTLQNVMRRASVFTGALCCLGGVLLSVSCDDERGGTPDWSSAPAVDKPGADELRPATASSAAVASAEAPGLRFMAYNVENWLTMERRIGDQQRRASKPDVEKNAAVRMVVLGRPDVLGICEIGTKKDVDDLQQRLKAAGWEMPHVAHDPEPGVFRQLALLSRFPIVSRDTPQLTQYQLLGRWRGMSRPILDATIEREGCRYRFVGVHLKSKREVREGDQEQIRRHEARLLRRHLNEVLEDDPAARLVVYGDFNDSLKSDAMKTVAGSYRTPTYLTAIPCADSQGHRWTHHWQYQDVYSRFDYVLVSPALKPETDFKASCIVDAPDWQTASDHRPLLTIFKSR